MHASVQEHAINSLTKSQQRANMSGKTKSVIEAFLSMFHVV